MFEYRFPRPALTVDCVVFGFSNQQLTLLLIERFHEPFANCWALPGGFVDMAETTEVAARRELAEETGLENVYLEQLYTFSAVNRDPRERVVTVAYYALVSDAEHVPKAADDARDARWFPADGLPPLAFDHAEIIATARARLQGKIRYQPIGFELLPDKFSLSQLQRLYECILARELDKRNFRKKILKMDFLVELDEVQQGVPHRAPRLYRFDKSKYERLTEQGFLFEI